MKQIEVTVRINNTLDEVDKILTSQGFKVIDSYRIEDEYLTQKLDELNKDNIIDILKSCVLIRNIKEEKKETKKIIYKIKEYKDNTVISEEKINVNIDNISNAIRLFNKLGFEELTSVKYDIIVYSNGLYEFAFQNVCDLGLLMEMEHPDDFTGYSYEDILKEKEKMLNIINSYNLITGTDYDIKKAYELVLKRIKNCKKNLT